jgi:lysophospholipase L1-like esterase
VHPYRSVVAIGDSFTEGVGDELPDGTARGWADLVAAGLQAATTEPVRYANLAVRGRLLGPILDEQLPAALAMAPDLLTVNGGGNDLLRPRVAVADLAERMRRAVTGAAGGPAHILVVTGADPTARLPLGRAVRRRGDALADAVRAWTADLPGVTFVDNWHDEQLRRPECWSADRLHLGAAGHRRVAGNVLRALGLDLPDAAVRVTSGAGPAGGAGFGYYARYVLPWVGRRLRGRSSGDGRAPKQAVLAPVPSVLG